MRTIVTFAALLTTGGLALASPMAPDDRRSAPTPVGARSEAPIRLAQQCGFYAILGCYGSAGQANSWNARIQGGYVINTTSAEYPNFRSGYYCVVNGPTSYGQAQAIANSWRGVIPDAYVKNAC